MKQTRTSVQRTVGSVMADALPVLASVVLASTTHAQWTVTNLNPAAPGVLGSNALSVGGAHQVGYIVVPGPENTVFLQAALWSGTAGSRVDLHPAGAEWSEAYASVAGRQGGVAYFASGGQRAGLWSGTAASWVDLHPAGTTSSVVAGMSAEQQVGWTYVSGREHAGLWSGTAASWIDLHPAGAARSIATGIRGGQQVGHAFPSDTSFVRHASLWSGTPGSWIDLHPAGATSSGAVSTDGQRQVGWVLVSGQIHASLWNGTAASWMDLNPRGARESVARAIHAGYQAGYVTFSGGLRRATLWSGTAGMTIDLHAFLPAEFTESDAYAIYNDATTLYVCGYAITFGFEQAMLWSRPFCVADADDGSGLGHPDGGVTIDDLLYYLTIFEQGVLRADVDDGSGAGVPDGGVTIDDLLYFLSRFEDGC